MRIDPKLKILSFLVVGAFLFSIFSAGQALAAGTSSKHEGFKAAQTKAKKILADKSKANNFGTAPAQQSNVAANQPAVYYGVYPGPNGPVYTWFIPAQPYGQTSGQTSVAGGGWRTPAGQGTASPQQNVRAPQAATTPDATGSPSICYYLPSWATTNWWNAPATSGGSALPAYSQPAQPASVGVAPTPVCYSGCVPSWGVTGYAAATCCAPACF